MKLKDPNPLDPREESVLKTLIEAYLEAGEPVGSRMLAKRYPEPLSSATIRNVLADLEEGLLVSQPHTSAGRVPTERAYRYYVDRWMNARSVRGAAATDPRLENALQGLDLDLDPESWARHAGKVLSEVLNGVCLALPVGLASSRLARLEFVPLSPGRAVAIWVGAGGEVDHRVLEIPPDFTAAQMVELGNFASERFQGATLPELQGRLLAELKSGMDEGRQLAARLQGMAAQWKAAGRDDASVLVSGLGQLGQLPEFDDLERFRNMVAAFEEQELLARLLNAFADQARTGVQLLLGSENPYLATFPLATLVRTVHLGPSGYVTFALVGPLRMDYPKVFAGLDWWGREVDRRHS